MILTKKFKVVVPYFDTGTKKTHIIEFAIDARNSEDAVRYAREKFDYYEKLSQAAWVRIVDENGIKVEEIKIS
ncbi:MAG: hypothetical protein QMC67_01630 [Candidatus Wallbacteria bacterium]